MAPDQAKRPAREAPELSARAPPLRVKPTSPREEKPVTGGPDDGLVDTAKRLGIATEGKTREEISKEIVQEASAGKATSSTA
jgi:hypothetical protein